MFNVKTPAHLACKSRISTFSPLVSPSEFPLSSLGDPSGESRGVWALVGTVILPGCPVFWRGEVGRGMFLRWWRCSLRAGMPRTTRVQNTAETTLRRLSATVTAAIISHDCQVRGGWSRQDLPSDCQQFSCAYVRGWRKIQSETFAYDSEDV